MEAGLHLLLDVCGHRLPFTNYVHWVCYSYGWGAYRLIKIKPLFFDHISDSCAGNISSPLNAHTLGFWCSVEELGGTLSDYLPNSNRADCYHIDATLCTEFCSSFGVCFWDELNPRIGTRGAKQCQHGEPGNACANSCHVLHRDGSR